jgi:two-component system KDP operon response regulator KdpE
MNTFFIPQTMFPMQGNSPHTRAIQKTLQRTTTQQKTVVIIDENPDFVRSVRDRLFQKGYNVVTATSPSKALSCAGCTPDLILCDMGLALRYGISTLQEIRKHEPSKRFSVVLVSWHGTLHDIRFALKIGADDCLPKLLSAETMAKLIDTRLQKIS